MFLCHKPDHKHAPDPDTIKNIVIDYELPEASYEAFCAYCRLYYKEYFLLTADTLILLNHVKAEGEKVCQKRKK